MFGLRDLLLKAKVLVDFSDDSECVESYSKLMHLVVEKEYADELKKLEEMSYLKDDEAKKIRFLFLCHARDGMNRGTYLHFATMPNSVCNELYFNIAKLFYPAASFQELFQILLPDVRVQWGVELIVGQTLQRKKTLLVSFVERSIADTNSLMKGMPIEADTFKRLVFLEQGIFVLDEIENFDFECHRQLHEQLAIKNLPLLIALTSHNQDLASLHSVIERLRGEGATLRDVILPIIRRMALSGESSGSGHFASEDGFQAAARLIAYHEHLPSSLKLVLDGLKHSDGVTSFLRVVQRMKAGDCIETASAHLLDILMLPMNQSVFDVRPYLHEAEREDLVRRYKWRSGEGIVPLNGSRVTTSLPTKLMKFFYRQIEIDCIDVLVSYLVSFPPIAYQGLLGGAVVDINISDCFDDVLGVLNDAQRKSFVLTLGALDYRFGAQELLTAFAGAGEYHALQQLIDSISPDDRFSIITRLGAMGGDSVLYCAAKKPGSLGILLNSLFDPAERLAAIKKEGHRGSNALYSAADTPESLQIMLNLFPSNRARLAAVLKKGHHRRLSVFHFSSTEPRSLQIILDFFNDDIERRAAVTTIGVYNCNVMHCAVENVHSLRILLNLFPVAQRPEILLIKDKCGSTVLHKAIEYIESLRFILDQFPVDERLAAVNDKNLEGCTVLHCAKDNVEAVKAILMALSNEEERVMALTWRNDECKSLLDMASKNYELLRGVLSQISRDTACRLIMEQRVKFRSKVFYRLILNNPDFFDLFLDEGIQWDDESEEELMDYSFYFNCLASIVAIGGAGLVVLGFSLRSPHFLFVGLGLGVLAGGLASCGLFAKREPTLEAPPRIFIQNDLPGALI